MEPLQNQSTSSSTDAPVRESAFTKVSRQLPLSPELISRYRPLLVLAGLAIGIGLLAAIHTAWLYGSFPNQSVVSIFKMMVAKFFMVTTIIYLAVASYLKLLDIPGFAARFRKYDIISEAAPAYATFYPFVEAGILAMLLSGVLVGVAPYLMIVVGGVGILSVLKAQKDGKDLECACLGTTYPFRIGKATLIENGFMALCGLVMLVFMRAAVY